MRVIRLLIAGRTTDDGRAAVPRASSDGVRVGLRRLHRRPDLRPRVQVEFGGGDRGEIGGEGEVAGEGGADLVAVCLQTGDLTAPDVAGAGAGGAAAVEGDGARGNATKTGPDRTSATVMAGPVPRRTVWPSA